jgi:putative SOS response-associated peptidase YedK
MCGRFTMTYPDAELLAAELGVPVESLPGYRPRFNIAPTDEHFILRIKDEVREVIPARWGLVNSWAKDRKDAARQINARAETLAARPAFRDAYARRRCVVPADGFYEWRREANGSRVPFRFHRPDGRLVLMAGLYESWRSEPGTWERTFTIVTTRANGVVSALHDRMPVVLGEEEADRWMFANTPRAELTSLLAPAPEGWLLMTAVSPRVNKVENDDPSVLEAPAGQSMLL